MGRIKTHSITGALIAIGILLAAACTPAADATATTRPDPTSTTAAATATTAAATATTDAGSGQNRPIPVVDSPDPNPDAQFGGTLRRLNSTYPSDFSPWEAATGTIIGAVAPANDTMMEYNGFETGRGGEILPNIVTDWWVDDTGLEWTFTLREGVLFTDGVEFTCADSQFMILTVRDSVDATGDELRQSPRARFFGRVDDVTCPDDNTMVITTDGPMPSLLHGMTPGIFQLLPKHVYEGNLEAMLDNIGPGLGAFTVDEIIQGEKITYERRTDYWNQPYPYLDRIEWIAAGSSGAVVSAMRVGRGEVGTISAPDIRAELVAEGRFFESPINVSHGFRGLQVNWAREPWNDVRFSQALRCAIDDSKAISTAWNGEGFEGPVFPLSSDPGGTSWGLSVEEWSAISPCHGLTAETDMEERRNIARGLLEEMGFNAENPARPSAMVWSTASVTDGFTVWQNDMELVNILPDVSQKETGGAYTAAYAGEFDMVPWSFLTPRHDPDHWLYEHFYSTSDRNYGKYTNPEVDALIDLQSVTLDAVARQEIIKEISTILLTDSAKIISAHSPRTHYGPVWLKDYGITDPSNMTTEYKFTRTWIDQALYESAGGQ